MIELPVTGPPANSFEREEALESGKMLLTPHSAWQHRQLNLRSKSCNGVYED